MTDLSEFGGGIDRSELTEAEQFHADLSDWVRSDAVSVYSREQKSYTDGTFENDSAYRPDLLIDGPSYTYMLRTQRECNLIPPEYEMKLRKRVMGCKKAEFYKLRSPIADDPNK